MAVTTSVWELLLPTLQRQGAGKSARPADREPAGLRVAGRKRRLPGTLARRGSPQRASWPSRQIWRVVHAYLKAVAQFLVLLGERRGAMLGEPLAPDRLTHLLQWRQSAFLNRRDPNRVEPVSGFERPGPPARFYVSQCVREGIPEQGTDLA